MCKKINVIMAGIGHHHADGIMHDLKFHSQYNVLGYYEPDNNVFKKKTNTDLYKNLRRYTYDEIKSDKKIQAFFVESPPEKQVETAENLLDLKLPIHFDKPLGMDFTEMYQLLEKMRDDNIKFQVGYMYRYNPAVLELKNLINQGVLGEIYNLEVVMNTENTDSFRTWLSDYPGGAMFILGSHMIDIVYDIMGNPINIFTFLKRSKLGSADSEDSCTVIFEYDKGIAHIQASCVEAGGYGRRRVIVSGSKATVEIQPLENPTKMYIDYLDYSKSYNSNTKKAVDLSKYNPYSRYQYMLDDFASIIRNDIESLLYVPDYDYEMNLQNLLINASKNKFKV